MGSYLDQAVIVSPPGQGTQKAVLAATSTSTANAFDLNAFAGKWVTFKSTVKTYVRFSSAPGAFTAVLTTDYYLTQEVDYPFYIPVGGARRYLRVRGAGTVGKLHYASVSDDVDV